MLVTVTTIAHDNVTATTTKKMWKEHNSRNIVQTKTDTNYNDETDRKKQDLL